MPLTISWRGFYKSQALRHHRIFVEERIRAYYARMGLEDWGVTVAETWYVFMRPFNAPPH
jgi:hypothetical protein